jgi:hypothetical protein
MNRERKLSLLLIALTTLFVFRVLGQVLVVCELAPWLPPMSAWQSGLLPYPALLAAQILTIVLMVRICSDLYRGSGWFFTPRKRFGIWVVAFGSIYLSGAVARAVLVATNPEQFAYMAQWIPIVLHMVLAFFVVLVGNFNLSGQAHNAFANSG